MRKLLSLLLIVNFMSRSRAEGTDSLKLLLEKQKHDTTDVLKIIKLAQKNTGNNPGEALDFLKKGLKISEEINFKAGVAKAYLAMGFAFRSMSKFDSARFYYQTSIDMLRQLNRKKDLITAYNNMGVIEKEVGNYPKAIDYYIQSLNIATNLKDNRGLGRAYSNIGIVYRNMKNYDKALEYQLKALHYDSLGKEKNALGRTFANLGNIYLEKKDYKRAVDYFENSVKIFLETNDNSSLSIMYTNTAEAYSEMRDFKKATQYARAALELAEEVKDPMLKGHAMLLLGEVNEKQEFYPVSEKNYLEALAIFKKIGSNSKMKDVYYDMSLMYRKSRQFEKSIDCFEKFNNLKDSLFTSDFSRQISEMEQKYESGKKQKEIEILIQSESIKDLQLKQKNVTIYAGIAIGLALIVFLFMVYRNLQQKKKTNHLLEAQNQEISSQKMIIEIKNKDIIDSINYAQRLQENILPPESTLKKLFPEIFVFYKPKDIVSGDFYWVEAKGDNVFVAVVDCTGHGVPGAIMSIVGNNLLNKIIREEKITSSEKILDSLVINVAQYLRQDGSNERISNDGMDITLCRINIKAKKLQLAGAYNPFMIVRNGNLTEYKADKFSVGRHTYEAGYKFKKTEIDLEKGDMLYLFSDGYADQFGGIKGKKFMRKNFYNLLKEISGLPVNEQNLKLEKSFNDWKQNVTQVDDVCVMGIRV
jgi:tetratricopeptide (TPR) repeat protein